MIPLLIVGVLWAAGGVFHGLHHAYLGRYVHQFLWLISFGGFGFGWLYDFIRLPAYIRESEVRTSKRASDVDAYGYPRKPLLSFARITAQYCFGWAFAMVVQACVPPAEDFPERLATSVPHLQNAMFAVGGALGIHVVGSVGGQTGPFIFLVAIIAGLSSAKYTAFGFLVAVLFFARYRRYAKERSWAHYTGRFSCRRLCYAWSAAALFYTMILGGLYMHMRFDAVNKHSGKPVKIRLRDFIWQYEDYDVNIPRNEGDFHHFFATMFGEDNSKFRSFFDSWDPFDRRAKAFETLEIPEESTQAEIRSAYKRMAMKWHPDKHKGAADADEVQQKFIDVQQAYEMLSRKSQKKPRGGFTPHESARS